MHSRQQEQESSVQNGSADAYYAGNPALAVLQKLEEYRKRSLSGSDMTEEAASLRIGLTDSEKSRLLLEFLQVLSYRQEKKLAASALTVIVAV